MTRLLNTAIIGPSAKTVASSWIDMLAGLSGEYILRVPPDFCATAVLAAAAISNPPIATNTPSLRFIWLLPEGVATSPFLIGFSATPQLNPGILRPVRSGSRSTCRRVVYDEFRRVG